MNQGMMKQKPRQNRVRTESQTAFPFVNSGCVNTSCLQLKHVIVKEAVYVVWIGPLKVAIINGGPIPS